MTTGVLTRPRRTESAGGSPVGGRLVQGDGGHAAAPSEGGAARLPMWSRRPSTGDLVSLCQHLGSLYGSGIPLVEALRTFAGESRRGVLRDALGAVVSDIESGHSLSEALDRRGEQFSPYFRASVRAGESSGTMGEVLERLARYLEDRETMIQRVRTAFAYPVMLVVMVICVTTFLVLYVVPTFAGIYQKMGVDLPLPTQLLMDVSGGLSAYPYAPAIPVVLLAAGLVWIRRSEEARAAVDRWVVHVPLVGPLVKRIVLYRFVRTFGEMMGSGLPVLECLELSGRVAGNRSLEGSLAEVRRSVERGEGLTGPFRRTGWFGPSLLQVIASGEQSGRLPALLERAAGMLHREVDLAMKRAVSCLEPLLTIGMAAVVGFILVAVYLPMFDVMQHAGR